VGPRLEWQVCEQFALEIRLLFVGEIEFNAVGCRSKNAGTEEVAILGPCGQPNTSAPRRS
jgi:hypothetical protein